MNKQELMENYTMEQLADMVVDLQKENLVEILKLKNREDTEDVQKVFNAMKLTIKELCNTIEKTEEENKNLKEKIEQNKYDMMQVDDVLIEFLGVTHEVMDNPHDFEIVLQKIIDNRKTIADFLPTEPIKAADMLISLKTENSICNIFDISELRQIAEHLLVYCNANEVNE